MVRGEVPDRKGTLVVVEFHMPPWQAARQVEEPLHLVVGTAHEKFLARAYPDEAPQSSLAPVRFFQQPARRDLGIHRALPLLTVQHEFARTQVQQNGPAARRELRP
jgi:hypothetical protein